MKLQDLKIGDIIINRKGQVGMYTVRRNNGYILYQDGGYDDVSYTFNDDLTDIYDGEDYDIMQIYREYFGGMICFSDYDEADLIFNRDEKWKNPNIKEKQCIEITKEKKNVDNDDSISIIAQCFYGNQTGTKINRNKVKQFLLGYIDDSLPISKKELESVNIKTLLVPHTDNIVIVYDEHKEYEYINVDFPEMYKRIGHKYIEKWGEELKPYVSCFIPEINFELHTRCFACRIDDYGKLQSLQNDDYKSFIHYFPIK